ncbi:GlpM protein [Salmonella enterica subsp. enterica serovar Typhi]|nr:GlpM protein [Salmonella enterica subsp. enterica serovar Typhi]
MGLVIKAALGALVVVLIGLLSKTKNYYIAGLIPLFPTFLCRPYDVIKRNVTGAGFSCADNTGT